MIANEGQNVQLVGLHGDEIVILKPLYRMTREQAVNLAAWLVLLSAREDDFIETINSLDGEDRPIGPPAPAA